MNNSNWPDLVNALAKAMIDIDAAINEIKGSDDPETACLKLVDIHRLKGDMAMVYDSATNAVSEVMREMSEVSLSNGMRIEKKMASTRKTWNHKDLANVVAKRIVESSVDLGTGEVVLSTEQMIEKMLVYVQPSYWRIKELSAIGINADRFCEVDEPKTSIIVRKGSNNG